MNNVDVSAYDEYKEYTNGKNFSEDNLSKNKVLKFKVPVIK